MKSKLVTIFLTLALLLPSFYLTSQSDDDLPSCVGYEFTAFQEARLLTLTEHFLELIDITSDTSNPLRFVNGLRRWAVTAHMDYLEVEIEGTRFDVEPAECAEYAEFDTLFLDIINNSYALYTQRITFDESLPSLQPPIGALFATTTEEFIENILALNDTLTDLADIVSNASIDTNIEITSSPAGADQWVCTGDIYNCSSFSTCAEAQSYFNTCPGDPSNLDRDGDGTPCNSLCGA